jgi:putative DNA primase/helicase
VTWTSFVGAERARGGRANYGFGFVFARELGLVGIDLDRCGDRITGHIEPWALDILRAMRTYAEWSPSGRGIHIICRATLPQAGMVTRAGAAHKVAMYMAKRFFTVSADPVSWKPS